MFKVLWIMLQKSFSRTLAIILVLFAFSEFIQSGQCVLLSPSDAEVSLCRPSPCKNNGVCQVSAVEGSPRVQCICDEWHEGKFCEIALDDSITFISSANKSAHFLNATRYFTNVGAPVFLANISFEFKTVDSSGLLLSINNTDGDFILIELFELGNKTKLRVTYSYMENVNPEASCNIKKNQGSEWHTFTFASKFLICDSVNSVNLVRRYDKAKRNGTLRFLSGSKGGISSPQFTGCLRRLKIGSKKVPFRSLLSKTSKSGRVLEGCNPGCQDMPCKNGGTCSEYWNKNFLCDCSGSIYSGKECNSDVGYSFDNNAISWRIPNTVVFQFLKFVYRSNPEATFNFASVLLEIGSKANNLVIYEEFNTLNCVLTIGSKKYNYQIEFPRQYNDYKVVKISIERKEKLQNNKLAIHVTGKNDISLSSRTTGTEIYFSSISISTMKMGGPLETGTNRINFVGCINNFQLKYTDNNCPKDCETKMLDFSQLNSFQTTGSPGKSSCNLPVPTAPPTTLPVTRALPTRFSQLDSNFNANSTLPGRSRQGRRSNDILSTTIIVIVVAAIAFVIILAIIFIIIFRKLKKTKLSKRHSMDKYQTDMRSNLMTNTYSVSPITYPDYTTDSSRSSMMITPNCALNAPVPFKPAYTALSILENDQQYLAKADSEFDLIDAVDQGSESGKRPSSIQNGHKRHSGTLRRPSTLEPSEPKITRKDSLAHHKSSTSTPRPHARLSTSRSYQSESVPQHTAPPQLALSSSNSQDFSAQTILQGRWRRAAPSRRNIVGRDDLSL